LNQLHRASARACFLVQRQGEASKSPFQIKLAGARLLAQKSIYVAYHNVLAADTGTWQVQQSCLHSNKSWWCFEPSHLIKCDRDHVPSHIQKHAIPSAPQAVYIARSRSVKTAGYDTGLASANPTRTRGEPEPTKKAAPKDI